MAVSFPAIIESTGKALMTLGVNLGGSNAGAAFRGKNSATENTDLLADLSVDLTTAGGAGATIGTTSDAAAELDVNGTVSAKLRGLNKVTGSIGEAAVEGDTGGTQSAKLRGINKVLGATSGAKVITDAAGTVQQYLRGLAYFGERTDAVIGTTGDLAITGDNGGTYSGKLRGLTKVTGALDDAAVSTDANGTVSAKLRGLIVLIVNLLTRWPASLGQKAMTASLPVVLASDQSAIPATQSGTWNVTNVSGTVSLPTGASTSANQTTTNASLSSIDTKLTSQATAANQATGNGSLSSIDTKLTSQATAANQTASQALLGTVTETAPASDTASSGLNGRLQRIAQRLSALIALLPASLGQKIMSLSLPVVFASDQSTLNTASTDPYFLGQRQIALTGSMVRVGIPPSANLIRLQAEGGDIRVAPGGLASATVGQLLVDGAEVWLYGTPTAQITAYAATGTLHVYTFYQAATYRKILAGESFSRFISFTWPSGFTTSSIGGKLWMVLAGNWSVTGAGSQAFFGIRPTVPGATNAMVVDTGTSRGWCWAIVELGSNSDGRLIVRGQDVNNYNAVVFYDASHASKANSIDVISRIGGVETVLASFTGLNLPANGVVQIAAWINPLSNSIYCWVDGLLAGSQDLSTAFQAYTNWGIGTTGITTRFIHFGMSEG